VAPIHRPQPTVTPPTSQNTTIVVLPSDISPVPDTFGWKKEQPTKHEHSQQESAAILMSSPYKMNLKKTKRGQKVRAQGKSSKIQLQKKRQSGPSDANTSIIHVEHEMRTIIILRSRRF
jgi:hypothetical protein